MSEYLSESDTGSENSQEYICENCYISSAETVCKSCDYAKLCNNCYYTCDNCYAGCCRFCSKKIYDIKENDIVLCLTCCKK